MTDTPEAAMQRVVHFFEHLQPADLSRIDELYTTDAHFKDPFNQVQGLPAIAHVFEHMFDHKLAPRWYQRAWTAWSSGSSPGFTSLRFRVRNLKAAGGWDTSCPGTAVKIKNPKVW
jgi:hypothetical protein